MKLRVRRQPPGVWRKRRSLGGESTPQGSRVLRGAAGGRCGANAPAVDAHVRQRRVGARGEDRVEAVVAALRRDCDEARRARSQGRALRHSHARRAPRGRGARRLQRRTRQLRKRHGGRRRASTAAQALTWQPRFLALSLRAASYKLCRTAVGPTLPRAPGSCEEASSRRRLCSRARRCRGWRMEVRASLPAPRDVR
jgi:hypothetical protein